jgi:hypothetical protein
MDTKKFEQLINLITNEDQEQARALFHDIVVEKSREIYESMMDEDHDMGMHGQVDDLLDEIDAEESGMMEDDSEFADDMGDDEDDMGDDEMDIGDEIELGGDDEFGEEGEEDLEDRVVDLEDKLDTLMAEFERKMNGDDEAEAGEDVADADQDFEAGVGEFGQEGDDDELDAMMEATEMKAVKNVVHGDNGVQTKSAIGNAANKGQNGIASRPVNFAGKDETVPTSPKTASNAYTKGEGSLKGAGSFKNAPGQSNKTMAPATKPATSQPAGTNQKSPVAESRRRK